MSSRLIYILFPVLLILFGSGLSEAQVFLDDELEYDSVAERILLKKEYTGGIIAHNLGFGINFRIGRNKTFFNSRIIDIAIVSMKHPKQVRVINPYYYNSRSYVYGKLNHVYMLRGGYGYKKLLNRKPYWGGVELRLLYQGGISIAFAKPVYLYFWDESYAFIKEEMYNPENFYHSSEYIYGRAPFVSGLDKIKIYPGIFVQAGLNFEFGKLNSKIRALEGGATLEYFPIPIPIMAFNPEQSLFATFYLNFQLGKRYN
jgi:hypothetical protein